MVVLIEELPFLCNDDITQIADAVLRRQEAIVPILQEVEDGQNGRGKERSDTSNRRGDEVGRVEQAEAQVSGSSLGEIVLGSLSSGQEKAQSSRPVDGSKVSQAQRKEVGE